MDKFLKPRLALVALLAAFAVRAFAVIVDASVDWKELVAGCHYDTLETNVGRPPANWHTVWITYHPKALEYSLCTPRDSQMLASAAQQMGQSSVRVAKPVVDPVTGRCVMQVGGKDLAYLFDLMRCGVAGMPKLKGLCVSSSIPSAHALGTCVRRAMIDNY